MIENYGLYIYGNGLKQGKVYPVMNDLFWTFESSVLWCFFLLRKTHFDIDNVPVQD